MPTLSKIKASIRTKTKPQTTSVSERKPNASFPPPVDSNGPLFELEAEKRQSTVARERELYLQHEKQLQISAEEAQRQNMQQAAEQSRLLEEERKRADAEKKMLERKQNASAESVRRLRGLIREKYRLDLYVWNKRKVQRANRKIIVQEYKKADAILQEIYHIVEAWQEDLFDAEEWKMAKKIKENLLQENIHAIWSSVPPWDYKEDEETTRRQL